MGGPVLIPALVVYLRFLISYVYRYYWSDCFFPRVRLTGVLFFLFCGYNDNKIKQYERKESFFCEDLVFTEM